MKYWIDERQAVYKEMLDVAKEEEKIAMMDFCLNIVPWDFIRTGRLDFEKIRYYYDKYRLAHKRKERVRYLYEVAKRA